MNELSIIVVCHSRVDILPNFIDSMSLNLMSNPGDIEIIIVTNEIGESDSTLAEFVREKYPWLKLWHTLQKYDWIL